MPGETRSRMVDAAVSALQRHGVDGMSFTEVLAASGAARGAIYHHFPGGKAQLVAEAAARNGDDVRAHLAGLPAPTPQATVDNCGLIGGLRAQRTSRSKQKGAHHKREFHSEIIASEKS